MSPRPLPASDLKGDAAFEVFVEVLADAGIAGPHTEYRFASPRRWRFDYCWPDAKVALEVEGGVWTKGGGRHNRGAGFRNDLEKYNRATVLGWRVIRVLPEQLVSSETLDMLKALLLSTDVFQWNP